MVLYEANLKRYSTKWQSDFLVGWLVCGLLGFFSLVCFSPYQKSYSFKLFLKMGFLVIIFPIQSVVFLQFKCPFSLEEQFS